MATITKEIIKKLKIDLMNDFLPVGEQLRLEGHSDLDICKIFNDYVNEKQIQFYNKERNFNLHISSNIEKAIPKPDSRIEHIFYQILIDSDIEFEFQYTIGPYCVDYLISKFLVLELDGPHHSLQKEYDKKRDKYLEKMGYKILRIPTWLTSISEAGVVESIREILSNEKNGYMCSD